MKLFIDSAKLDEIKKAIELGCDGVTTNPSLIKKAIDTLKEKGETVDMEEYIKLICKTAGNGKPVNLEVVSTDAEKMIEEAKILYKKFNPIANNIIVKIPINTWIKNGKKHSEGLETIRKLSKEGIGINATLIMTPEQALLAAKAGARYASPFAGRIDDFIRKGIGIVFKKTDYFPAEGIMRNGKMVDDNGIVSGVDLIKKIAEIYRIHKISTEVIAASMRNSRQVRESALAGAHIATVPFSVIEDMIKHPKTVEGMIKFSEDVIPEYKRLFE